MTCPSCGKGPMRILFRCLTTGEVRLKCPDCNHMATVKESEAARE